jgi:hypothetical protein
MKRLALVFAMVVLVFGLAAPAVLAADPSSAHTGPVLMAFNGDVTVPAGDQADVVFVTGGTATIQGQVRSLVVIDGQAILEGARLESVFVTGGSLAIDAATTVTGDVRTLDTTVTVDPAATIGGTVRTLDADLIATGAFIVPAIVLFMLGFAVVTLVAGLALAALASRQVRTAEALITKQPGETLLFGLAGLFVIPLVAILAMITVIGAPLGLAILLMVWPAAAFAGYLVAAIWIGDFLLSRRDEAAQARRPYLAATLGIVVLWIVSFVPFVGAIASLFGFGAVLLMAWRTFRQPTTTQPVVTPPAAQRMGV